MECRPWLQLECRPTSLILTGQQLPLALLRLSWQAPWFEQNPKWPEIDMPKTKIVRRIASLRRENFGFRASSLSPTILQQRFLVKSHEVTPGGCRPRVSRIRFSTTEIPVENDSFSGPCWGGETCPDTNFWALFSSPLGPSQLTPISGGPRGGREEAISRRDFGGVRPGRGAFFCRVGVRSQGNWGGKGGENETSSNRLPVS